MAMRHLHSVDRHSHVCAYDRLPVQACMYFSSNESEGIGTVRDVSLGGWRVRSTKTHVKPGDAVRLFATLPDHQEAVLVDQAKICWSRGEEFGLAIRKIPTQDADASKSLSPPVSSVGACLAAIRVQSTPHAILSLFEIQPLPHPHPLIGSPSPPSMGRYHIGKCAAKTKRESTTESFGKGCGEFYYRNRSSPFITQITIHLNATSNPR